MVRLLVHFFLFEDLIRIHFNYFLEDVAHLSVHDLLKCQALRLLYQLSIGVVAEFIVFHACYLTKTVVNGLQN